jgi:hypothetical protein
MERTGLAEQKYLLSLLGVAEELLALMPPGVQRKYGLIKGTLAVQLGSDVHLHADSAILASLTTGIQPQISSATRHSEATPDSRERAKRFNIPESPQQRPLSAGPAGGSGDVKAAVVRSLDSELEPAGFAECESGSGSSAAPATSHHGGALGLVPAALQDDHHDVAEHGNAVEQVQEGARDDSHGPAVRASMMRHHLRALRACISRVRASCAATDDAERGTVKPHSDARGSEVTPSDDGLEGGHRMEAEANCEAGGIPDFLRPQAERDVEATSVTELLMECSEALGTLQVLPQTSCRWRQAVCRSCAGFCPACCVVQRDSPSISFFMTSCPPFRLVFVFLLPPSRRYTTNTLRAVKPGMHMRTLQYYPMRAQWGGCHVEYHRAVGMNPKKDAEPTQAKRRWPSDSRPQRRMGMVWGRLRIGGPRDRGS